MARRYHSLIIVLSSAFAIAACSSATVQAPMERHGRRATPLHYGLKVSPDPEENPIDPPERFSGYHVATDFEVGEDELETDVPVFAICTGSVAYSGFAEGYGGLLVQRCSINGEPVTVIYGHLTIVGLPQEGKRLKTGTRIGILAPARTYDSGGNRKHLHLGIHKGKNLDIRGYVQTEEEVKTYIDPMTVLPTTPADALLPEVRPYWASSEWKWPIQPL